MENTLIEIFGKIVKTSRDTGLIIASNYKNHVELPKVPDNEQQALINLIKSLNDEQFELLTKGMKYCIDLSLFKLISTIESGVSDYSFNLSISNSIEKFQIIGENIDNEISSNFWNWVEY